jgi:hypothetical protein
MRPARFSLEEDMEKVAIRETLRLGSKAVREALMGNTKLSAPPGLMHAERQSAVAAGQDLMGRLQKRGIRTHRARVKSPSSMAAKGLTSVPDDLLGMQAYGSGPQDVDRLMKALRAEGVEGLRASAKTRPGYHGINIKGTYRGTPVEYQVSPGRISNVGQMLEHSLGYKQATEAPRANRIDKWVGKAIAPRLVNFNAGRRLGLDPSWVDDRLPELRRIGVE